MMKRAKDLTLLNDLIVLGFLDLEDAERLRTLRAERTPRIGQLALRLGFLDVEQIFATLNAASEQPEERFGETAIRLGFIEPEQLVVLLANQRRQVPDWRDLLRETGALTGDRLDEALTRLSSLERRAARLAPRPPAEART